MAKEQKVPRCFVGRVMNRPERGDCQWGKIEVLTPEGMKIFAVTEEGAWRMDQDDIVFVVLSEGMARLGQENLPCADEVKILQVSEITF